MKRRFGSSCELAIWQICMHSSFQPAAAGAPWFRYSDLDLSIPWFGPTLGFSFTVYLLRTQEAQGRTRVDRRTERGLSEQIRREDEHGGGTIRGIAGSWGFIGAWTGKQCSVRFQLNARDRYARARRSSRRGFLSKRFWKRIGGHHGNKRHGPLHLVPDQSGTTKGESGRMRHLSLRA